MADLAAPGRVLIWDFDGTLGRRPGHWSGAIADALTDVLGPHDFSRAMISAEIRDGFPWHAPQVPHPLLADSDAWWRHLGRVLAAAIGRLGVASGAAAAAANRVRPHYTDPASWQLFPDAVPTLAALSGLGWRHVLLSNHVPELPEIVTGLGLGRYFNVIVNSAATGYEKPHPQAFRLALERAGWPSVSLDDRGQSRGRCRGRRQCRASRHPGTDPASRRQPLRAGPGGRDRPCQRLAVLGR